MNCVFVHASSTNEFGAMRSDCLVQFSILNPFFEPPWIAFSFMRPPPTSLEPCVVIAECNPPFSRVFHRQGRILLTGNVIFVMFPIVSFSQKCICILYLLFLLLFVLRVRWEESQLCLSRGRHSLSLGHSLVFNYWASCTGIVNEILLLLIC